MSCNKHHLMWIRDRLLLVHKEPINVDYMLKLQNIIEAQGIVCTPAHPCELRKEYEVEFSDGTPVSIYEEMAEQYAKDTPNT